MTKHTKTFLTAAAAIASASILPLGVHAQILGSVGIYDENLVNTNTWNHDVPVDKRVSSSVLGAAFTSNVLAAYNNNLGGVANFDGAGESITFTSGVSANNRIILGTGAALQLDFTLANSPDDPDFLPNGNNMVQTAGGNNRTPISGTHRLNNRYSMIFTFNGIYAADGTTLLSDHGVTQFGITMLDRDNLSWTGDVVVTFSDATTQTVSALTVAQGAAVNDTFVGFAAPSGLLIDSVAFKYTSGGQYIASFDDLGIIVIPEPSTYVAILGLIGLAVVAWRRRVRR